MQIFNYLNFTPSAAFCIITKIAVLYGFLVALCQGLQGRDAVKHSGCVNSAEQSEVPYEKVVNKASIECAVANPALKVLFYIFEQFCCTCIRKIHSTSWRHT